MPDPVWSADDDVIVLKAGEGALLASGRVLRGAEVENADVVCQDVLQGWGATLGCAHGGAQARFPRHRRIELLDPKEVVARVEGAPEDLGSDRVRLAVNARNQPGFGYVRGGEGGVWKVWAVHVTNEPVVLDRSVHLRRDAATPMPKGGEVRFPRMAPVAEDAADQEYRRRLVDGVRALPGAFPNVGHPLLSAFATLEDAPRAFGLTGYVRVQVDDPFSGRIQTHAYDGVRLTRGITSSGEVDLDHHSGCLVEGVLEGKVNVDDHAVLVVDGDVLGTVVVGSHAAVKVLGDMRGTLVLGGHTKTILLGGLSGRLDLTKASHTHLLLAWPLDRLDIERLPGPGLQSHCTLHVPSSDLGDGVHEKVGRWPKVQVGREVFDQNAR